MSDKEQPIIIIKKKAGHHGHHGGAWKVAYADFVTAMMALFIVLWLLSSDEKVRQSVGGYFQDPTGNGRLMGSTMSGSGEGLALKKDDMDHLKEKIEAALKQTTEFQKMSKQIKITVTGEGLRIELIEDEKGVFFDSGSANPSENGRQLVAKLASELGRLPNNLYVEGHTDAKPFSSVTGYSNWELSTDRANAARRIMQSAGVRPDQIGQVRGFADQRLRNLNDPQNPSNRRVSVIVQYLNTPPPEKEAKGKKSGEAEKGAEKPKAEPAHDQKPATAAPQSGKKH